MTSKPTILIAGDRNIRDILAKRLPSRICNIVDAGTFVAALSEAADASVVVVDGEMPGYQELCGHLRGDPVTADIPLLFLSHTGKEDPGVRVDETVPFRDPAMQERALRKHCPELALSSGPAPGQDVPEPEPALPNSDVPDAADEFDDKSSTAMFRRPATEPGTALEWPPPPPERKPKQELVDYAREYAGYFNSLIEALEKPDKLSDAEKVRLAQVSDLTLADAEALIASVQTAMNEALRETNLDLMRVLSTGKNKLYEKRQKLRSLVSDSGLFSRDQKPERRVTGPTEKIDIPETGWDMDSDEDQPAGKGAPGSGSQPIPAPEEEVSQPAVGKSALTMAAEARDLERRKTARQTRIEARKKAPDAKVKQRQRRPSKKPERGGRTVGRGSPSYTWVWIPVTGLIVLMATLTIVYSMGKREPDNSGGNPDNTPPAMKWVLLEQGPAGVIARPSAEDADGHRITYSVTWYKGNAVVEGERTARLKPTNYKPGDVVFVEVTPSDMYDKGRAMRSRELVIKEDFGNGRPAR